MENTKLTYKYKVGEKLTLSCLGDIEILEESVWYLGSGFPFPSYKIVRLLDNRVFRLSEGWINILNDRVAKLETEKYEARKPGSFLEVIKSGHSFDAFHISDALEFAEAADIFYDRETLLESGILEPGFISSLASLVEYYFNTCSLNLEDMGRDRYGNNMAKEKTISVRDLSGKETDKIIDAQNRSDTHIGNNPWELISWDISYQDDSEKRTDVMQIDNVGCIVKTYTKRGERESETSVFVPGVKMKEIKDSENKFARILVSINDEDNQDDEVHVLENGFFETEVDLANPKNKTW